MAPTFTCYRCKQTFETRQALTRHRNTVHKSDALKCDICHQQFFRKSFYQAHRKRHTNGNHECVYCNEVFVKVENLQVHINNNHAAETNFPQLGDQAGPSDADHQRHAQLEAFQSDPSKYFKVKKTDYKNMQKFQTTATTYAVTFTPISALQIEGLVNILRVLRRILESVMDEVTQQVEPHDMMRVLVQNPELYYPIVVPFKKKSDFSIDDILGEIERVLQSYQDFMLDQTLEIHVIHVKMPSGSGWAPRKFIDHERFLKEKRCIIQIKNKDDLCCARAIVTARAKIDKSREWNSIRQGRMRQRDLAQQLHTKARVRPGPCGLQEVEQFQKVLPGYQIFVVWKEHLYAIFHYGPDSEKKLFLYLHDKHYDVITSMAAFFNTSHFCFQCEKGYGNKETHKCNNPCPDCRSIHDLPSSTYWHPCGKCGRRFNGEDCFQRHLSRRTCEKIHECSTCHKLINLKLYGGRHECGKIYCKICDEFQSPDHQCYMKPVQWKKKMVQSTRQTRAKKSDDTESDDQESGEESEGHKSKKTLYIFWDLECTQDTGRHVPNLCVAHRVRVDGVNVNNKHEEFVFEGSAQFCKWLFTAENKGAICICHNFKGYDSYFVLQYLYDNGIKPESIMNGTKVMKLEVKEMRVRFIDSINFLPMPLAHLPKTFGFNELCKGYFPHLFNTSKNQGELLYNLPDEECYGPAGMKPSEREEFYKWYEVHKNEPFNLQEELLKYCKSDVDILRRCCLQFRNIFMTQTEERVNGELQDPGVDPFQYNITISSACNLVFRKRFLKPRTIGIIPEGGYNAKSFKQSLMATKWIRWYANENKVEIKHARNGSEIRIGQYRVDGLYSTEEGKKVVLEFHGDFWHGNPERYSQNMWNPRTQCTMGELYQRTVEKRKYLEAEGYTVIEMWESDFKAMAGYDQMESEDVDPVSPRDAFYGGRTECFVMYKEVDEKENEQIKYVDFTSLYPWTNKCCPYPVGHPEVITENFKDIGEYEGLIKCKILPPQNLYLPLLPCKVDDKLIFTLCRRCAEIKNIELCQHDEEERALTGTWISVELKKAVELGYRILAVYEVWHYQETSNTLFSDYINTFLRLKQEASDWPEWTHCKASCPNQPCEHTKMNRKQYVDKYKEKEGIDLRPDKIENNPGLRSLAKQMLNSFWGKFGQRDNLPKTTYVGDSAEYFGYLTSEDKEIKDVRYVNEEMVEVTWKFKEDFAGISPNTNVILAAYTTAHARLRLYTELERLGKRALYCDTDSIIYSVRLGVGEYDPPLGDFLGELKNELCDGDHIVTFASGGPKNYAYRTFNGKETCKIRGITLNYRNGLKLNAQTVFDMVQGIGPETVTSSDPYKIVRDRESVSILTRTQNKDYRIVFDKRVKTNNLCTVPYGYKET